MAADALARADPIPLVMSYLAAHDQVSGALGTPGDASGRIGPGNAPPYPRVRLFETPSGSDGDLRRLISPELQVEVLGDLDGAPGKAELRRIAYLVLGALAELPDQPAPPGGPVVTAVLSSRAVAWLPEPTGQPRYLFGVRVYCHAAP